MFFVRHDRKARPSKAEVEGRREDYKISLTSRTTLWPTRETRCTHQQSCVRHGGCLERSPRSLFQRLLACLSVATKMAGNGASWGTKWRRKKRAPLCSRIRISRSRRQGPDERVFSSSLPVNRAASGAQGVVLPDLFSLKWRRN